MQSSRTMSRKPCRGRGFTLIELLVVIAILSLLMVMLMPALTKARELARRAMCMANNRHLSEAVMGFAAANSGRGPGSSLQINGTWTSSLSWADILNTEYFHSYVVQRMGFAPTKGLLYCPNIRYQTSIGLYPRAWAMNNYVQGGASVDPNIHSNNMYSKWEPTSNHRYLYSTDLAYYFLGAQLDRFPRPSYEIMVLEQERGGDGTWGVWPYSPIVLNTEAPAWCAFGASYSFRHTLGPDPKLYQQQATACYVFIDGHVDVVQPTMNINQPDRFYLGPP